jgi:hypothetical protein
MSSLLVDFNNLAFRTIFNKEVEITSASPNFQLWKYLTFNSLYLAIQKSSKINEVIVAMDDTQSWRKALFPRYKESRKKNRDKQKDIDWNQLYENFNGLAYDIKNNIPFKVMKILRCEADDIIGVLTLDRIEQDVVIISNDEDYMQLCSNKVKLYRPDKQEYRECKDPEMFIVEKSLLGQSKDDIFNIKTPDDFGLTPETEGKRKPGFGPAALKKVMDYGWEKWLVDNKLEDRFYKRNRPLMDFKLIPKPIRNNIIKVYNEYELPDAGNIYKFFSDNKFRGFLEDFTKVENRLLRLY